MPYLPSRTVGVRGNSVVGQLPLRHETENSNPGTLPNGTFNPGGIAGKSPCSRGKESSVQYLGHGTTNEREMGRRMHRSFCFSVWTKDKS